MEEIINKVTSSGLLQLDLEEFFDANEQMSYDIAQHLFQGLVLKEKDFRTQLKAIDWTIYQDKHIAITCSSDAIIPTWAYMLLSTMLSPYTKTITFGTKEDLHKEVCQKIVDDLDLTQYEEQKVVIKGCSSIKMPPSIYIKLTQKLQPVVASIMFGEPCSTVPVFKKKKIRKKKTI